MDRLKFNLLGKDYLTEAEAAHYACVSEFTQPTREIGMDDSRLLELAGKAAGEHYNADRNPLERDDLALRLAVRFGLTVEVGEQFAYAFKTFVGVASEVPINTDPYAATRRAIVRAAAEMGGEEC